MSTDPTTPTGDEMYLDCAREQIRVQWTPHPRLTDYDEDEALDLAARPGFRAAIDAARAPLLAEVTDMAAEIERLRVELDAARVEAIDQRQRAEVADAEVAELRAALAVAEFADDLHNEAHGNPGYLADNLAAVTLERDEAEAELAELRAVIDYGVTSGANSPRHA